ncbi:MAG: hypothetical protein ACRDJP_14490 [Actinomycetota bacterium]
MIQETPQGDIRIVVEEVEDPSRMRLVVPGGTPYDDWWLDYARDVHGIDFRIIPAEQQASPPTTVLDWPGG